MPEEKLLQVFYIGLQNNAHGLDGSTHHIIGLVIGSWALLQMGVLER